MNWLEENMNHIVLGDSQKFIQLIPNNSIDLIVTDPPYLINYKTNHRKNKEHKFCKEIAKDNNPDLVEFIIKQLYRILKDNSAMYIFCSFDKVDWFKRIIEKSGFNIKNMIVWVKNNWTAGDLENAYGKQYELCFYVNKGLRKIEGKRLTDVWDSKNINGLKRVVGMDQIHQNQKPLELIKLMIEKSSNENDIVFDPFSGSGTTCVASKELNRRFLGIEIDEEYFDLSVDRLNGIRSDGQTSIFTDFESMEENK